MTNTSGWRKRQIALDQKAENAKELGLDYELESVGKLQKPTAEREWVGLTRDEQSFVYDTLKNSTSRKDSFWVDFANAIEKTLKDKNT